MIKTQHTNTRASKTTLNPSMHSGDRPEAYARLAPAKRAALLEWIRLVIKPAKTVAPNTSYSIKHDFERVGFYITNGQFKGAMLAAGYAPVDPNELNWEFRIRPTGKRRESKNGVVYHLNHLAPEDKEVLDALVKVAKNVRLRRREENHRDIHRT
jgi:hypothetical protein